MGYSRLVFSYGVLRVLRYNIFRLAIYGPPILVNGLLAFDKWTSLPETVPETASENIPTHIFRQSSILPYKSDFSVEDISKQSIYCLFVYLAFYLLISLFFYLFIFLFLYLFIFLLLCLFICSATFLSVYLGG